MAPYTPTDIEVSEAVNEIQAQATEGNIGRAKIHAKLKEVYLDWVLSINRLKRILTSADSGLQIPQKPGAALKKQEAYKRGSIPLFFIYGPSEYTAERLAKALKASWPSEDEYQQGVSQSIHLQTIWDYYTAAAKIAGVSKDVVAKQIEAEYNIPTKLLPVPYNELPTQEIEARKVAFKREDMKVKREMLKHPEARSVIPVDSRGEPVWDDAKNGQFVLIVVRIDKYQGLQEFGRV